MEKRITTLYFVLNTQFLESNFLSESIFVSTSVFVQGDWVVLPFPMLLSAVLIFLLLTMPLIYCYVIT